MDIDIYQPCPCNSGKKIKFCCAKDITADLNQILSKSAAKQSAAAIDLIDRVVERVGQRDCLSIIKTHILLSVEELEKAQATNDEFLAASPKHAIGLQHQALIKVGQGDIHGAVKSLQKATNAIPGNEIPISFANAFRTVGSGLISVGHLLAARAHYNYSLMLKGSDEQTQALMIRTYQLPNISLLLKQDLRLDPVPEDESLPWRKHYANVIRALDRGQFLFGLKILKKADEESPNVPEIKRGIAILATNLALESEIGSSWREYARLPGLSRWDAVEAEAFAQMLGAEEICEQLDYVSVRIELSDLERASEAAIANPRMVAEQIQPQEEDSGPPPRFCFSVLDRDEPKDSSELTFDVVPQLCAEMLMFGKQTDRNARIEYFAAKDESHDELVRFITETFADEIVGEPVEEVVGAISLLQHVLTWRWHIPRGTSQEQYSQLEEVMRREVLLERWPNTPLLLLDGKTPVEAAEDEANSVVLESLVIQLQTSSDQQVNENSLIDQLREKLKLPTPEMVDPETMGDRLVSPVRQKYLIVEKLSDEQLIGIQSEAMAIGNVSVLKMVIPEILNRESTNAMVPHDMCHSVMAQLVPDEKEAIGHLHQARQIAKQNNRPFGTYLVQELELCVLRGKQDRIPTLLREIETNHLNEPDVEYQLVRVLQRFGLITPDGRMAQVPGEPTEAPAADAGGLWTPDQGSQAPAAEAESSDSKLWIPGQ